MEFDKELMKKMHQLTASGNLEEMKKLFAENEGLLNATTYFGTWLHDAASYGQYETAKYLIEQGIDINAKGGTFDSAAINEAALDGHLDVVELLLENGAEMDVSNDERNPLFSAIYNGHFDVVKCLVEHGIDLTPKYEVAQFDDMDAHKYAWYNGETEIEDYLREKMGAEKIPDPDSSDDEEDDECEDEEIPFEGNLEKERFIELFKNAAKDIFPKIKEKYEGETIYGISFEIANTVCLVYDADFETYVYINTEERYAEAIEDEEEEDNIYFRFFAFGEWTPETCESESFTELQKYLLANCSTDDDDEDEDYDEDENEDIVKIRYWQAEALGQLRDEGFWAEQGNPDIQVIPFEGEDEISIEELAENYKTMDRGYHGDEYQQYIEYLEENK